MNIDEKTLREIVAQVIATMQCGEGSIVRSEDPISGVKCINCSNLEMERLDTGNPKDQVWVKDVITDADNKNLAAGFLEIKETEFDWELPYDEIDYIIDGELTIKINGKNIVCYPGDVLLLPKGIKFQWSAKKYSKSIYITYPANWQDLLK